MTTEQVGLPFGVGHSAQTPPSPFTAPSPPAPQGQSGPIREQSLQDAVREEFGLNIPTAQLTLPSRGAVYDQRLSIHGHQTVEVRPMTTREEDILTNRALAKKGTIISELIKSCLVDRDINPSDLIAGDRLAILYGIRASSYGHEYEAEVTCTVPECEKKSPQIFDLSQFEFKFLDIDPVAPGLNLFSFTLPMCKLPVQFKFLTGRDEEEIATTLERQKKMNLGGSNTVSLNLMHTIVSVNGVTDRGKLSKFVSQMPAYDSSALRKYMTEHQPGLKTVQNITCPACGAEQEVEMPMGVSFLWPNAG